MDTKCNPTFTDKIKTIIEEKKRVYLKDPKKCKIKRNEKKCANRQSNQFIKYIQIPLKATLSNYKLQNELLNSTIFPEPLDYTGSAYDDIYVNVPSEFQELSENRAIIHGHTHSGSDVYNSKEAQNAVSCVMSILMKTVRPVKSWFRSTLDDILKLSDDAYSNIKKNSPFLNKVTAADMNKLKYQIDSQTLIVNVDVMTVIGTITSKVPLVPNLTEALHKFFLINNSGVVETNTLAVAVWYNDDSYYMFEPYQCDIIGVRITEENKTASEKSTESNGAKDHINLIGKCCAMRFPNIDALVTLFLNNIDRKNRNDYFVIRHVIPVKDVPGAQEWHDFKPAEIGKSWILRGTITSANDLFEEENRGVQGITIPVVALITAHQIPPSDWSALVVDDVITKGDSYYYWCRLNMQDDTKKTLTANALRNKLYLGKKKVHINVEDSVVLGHTNNLNSDNKIDVNLEDGINQFFNEHQYTYGIFEIHGNSVAIWKCQDETKVETQIFSYYLFDPNPGNKLGQFKLDDEEKTTAAAYVMRFLDPKHLAEFIRSNFGDEDGSDSKNNMEYFIHSLNVLSIGDELNESEIEEDKLLVEKPEYNHYIAINEDAACLQGNFAQNNPAVFEQKTRDKQQSANAIVALTMTKLHNPHLWHSEMVDDILRIGDKLTLENLRNLPLLTEADDDYEETRRNFLLPSEIKAEFNIGIFKITTELEEEAFTGNFGDLDDIVTEFFDESFMGILHQDNISIPLWKEGEIFFMMDSRGRDKHGQPDDKNGSATVIWTTSISQLCSLLKLAIKDSDDEFVIDTFHVKGIDKFEMDDIKIKAENEQYYWYSFQQESDGVWTIKNDKEHSNSAIHEQSLMISIIALLFYKIYKPKQLNLQILNEIIEIGNKFYINSKNAQGENSDISLNNISRNLYFTNRRFQFTVHDCIQAGKLKSETSKILNLEQGLQNYFAEYNSGILIIDGVNHIAMLEDDGYFYCFIPDYEVLRLGSLELMSQQILQRYEQSQDYEISMIDIINYPDTMEIDCVFNSKINSLKLPPLNAFKKLHNTSEAILSGSIGQTTKIISPEIRGKQSAASCAVALAMSVLQYPSTWTKKTLDEIIIVGLRVYNESITKAKLTRDKVKITDVVRIIEIGNNTLTVDIEQSATVNGLVEMTPPPKEDEKQGKKEIKPNTSKAEGSKKDGKDNIPKREKSPSAPTKLLKEGLESFLKENNAGVVVIGKSMSAVWKDSDVYFIYKPFARSNAELKNIDGSSYLKWFICLQPLINEIKSDLNINELYEKYEIYRVIVKTVAIKAFPHPPGFECYLKNDAFPLSLSSIKKISTLSDKLQTNYCKIDEGLSILIECANKNRPNVDLKSRPLQSSAVAAIAITVSQLHHPSTWTTAIINAILEYGENLHTESAQIQRSKNRNLLPHELCTNFIIANFQVSISLKQSQISGVFQYNDLMLSLSYFIQLHPNVILHVGNAAYAIMKDDMKYFLFHPNFQNSVLSHVGEQSACVLQCATINKLLKTFMENLSDLKSSVYMLYEMNVDELQFFSKRISQTIK